MTHLSIVIPARNESALIGATLASVQPLRARGHEAIVVDGGSDDATRAIATPLADHVLVAHRGRATQMNAGAARATGDALVFLHADTQLPAGADFAIARALVSGARWGRFRVAIQGTSVALPLIARLMNLRSRITGIATGDQTMFVAKGTFDEVGGFPPIPIMEDVALSARLKQIAGPPACLSDVVTTSGRRWDIGGVLRTVLAMWRLRYAYWRGNSVDEIAPRYGERALPRLSGSAHGAAATRQRVLPTLQVFVRAPIPGSVKTRLAATIGAERATSVYRALAERTLAAAAAARAHEDVADVELWCAPPFDAPIFAVWSDRHGAVPMQQCDGDLGARMRHALSTSLARDRPALLIGSDCAGFDGEYLREAAAALAQNDVVIGPASDGGYVLIGLARDVDLFTDIEWSTPQVYAKTRERITALGLRAHTLPMRDDIDTVEDLARHEALAGTMRA